MSNVISHATCTFCIVNLENCGKGEEGKRNLPPPRKCKSVAVLYYIHERIDYHREIFIVAE